MTWTSYNSKLFSNGFTVTATIVSVLLSLGCHPLSTRLKGPARSIDTSTDDDWAPPKSSPSRYSQPQPYVRRTKSNETENSPTSRSSQAVPPAAYQPHTKAGAVEGTLASTAPKVSNAKNEKPEENSIANIQETNQQTLDIEGALAALPANYREIARRQLETIRSTRLDTESEVESKPSSSDSMASKSSKESAVESEPSAIAKVKLGLPQADEPKSSPKVLAKLTDQEPSNIVQASNTDATSEREKAGKTSSPVVSAVAIQTDAKEPVARASATVSKPAAPSLLWNSSVDEAINKLEEELKKSPTLDENIRLSQELTLRFLYLANRQLNNAMKPIEGLEDNERDYYQDQIQALYEASNPDAIPSKRRVSLVMNSQRQATNHLAAASNLEVRSLAFCTDVQGFGVLSKFPKYQFKPDQEVLLYCELENVLAQKIKAGFETELQGTYEIIDPNGRRVADQLLPMEKEICQNHRRDYFIIYHIFMPLQIAPGNYQMRVTIEDMKASKFGQASLDFQIQK